MSTILVVDDQRENREFISSLLGYKSYRVIEANDGLEALSLVRAERPDLVVCDILMPTMDGFAFVQALKDDPVVADTPVIFYTAHYLEREAAVLAAKCGVQHVITKPAEPQRVLEVVMDVLQGDVSRPTEPPQGVKDEHLRLVTDKLSQTADELIHANGRLSALIELNLRLASERDPKRLLEQVCLGARQLLGARCSALGVRDRETLKTVYFVCSGIPNDLAVSFGLPPIDRGILGTVMSGGRAYRIARPKIGAAAAGLPEGFAVSRSLLAAPVTSPTNTYGWVCLTDKLVGEFDDEDERILSMLAGQAGRFYENGSLYRKVQVHAAEMELEIEERIRAENRIRDSEWRFRALIEQASDGIFVIDSEGRFQLANSRSCEMLGYSEDELLKAHHRITYVEGEGPTPSERMEKAKTGAIQRYERMVLRKGGRTFPAEFSSRMLADGSFQVIFRDITDRKRAEQLLRDSEEKYRQLIEQASDGIFISDTAGNFLLVNSSGCELLGYRQEELLGKSGKITYLEQERDIHTERIRQAMAGATLRFERTVRKKDGSVFPAEISIKKIDSGLVQVIFRDITERVLAQQELLAGRTLLRTLIDALPDVVFAKDSGGRFTMCNTAAFANSGFKEESGMLGKTVFDLYPRDLAQPYHDDDMQTLTGRPVVNREEPGVDASGLRRWFLTIKAPLRDPSGSIRGLIGISRDITERKLQEDKIVRLNRIQTMLSGINSAIVRIQNQNELFAEACRIATELGKFPIALIGILDDGGKMVPAGWGGAGDALLAALPAGAQGGPRGVATRSIREKKTIVENDILREPDVDEIRKQAVARGCRSVISLPLYRNNEPVGMFLLYGSEKNAFDAEEIKLLEELAGDVSFALSFMAQREKADYLAYYDVLTGFPNRTLFFDRLGWQLAAAQRDASSVALVLLDLNRFRMVNDTLGRQAGDALLKAIAERIRSAVREQDIVSRFGSDVFSIAVTGTWRAQELAYLLETRYRDIFATPYWIGDEELRVSATAGVAVSPADADNAETLVANAEAALRSAKKSSTPLLFYGPEMNAQVAQSLRLETRLRRAIELQQLVLWYQPKLDARTGALRGFEALMRWNDPESGMVSPAKFIPILEQTGLILAAGNWALHQVANDCAGWVGLTPVPPRVAVNVSPLQLRDKNFVANVISAAELMEQKGGALDLEITESVIMDNVDAVIPKLQTVRGLGVQIYIDDFGTGYSSLAYIARLPIHALKIDRSFIVGLTQSEDSLNIVRSVISLAQSLKLRVVAEGVETAEQAQHLQRLGCDELQGFLYSKPVPAEQIGELIRRFPQREGKGDERT